MTTSRLGELDLESAAKEAAGNWQHFDSFWWHRSKKTSKMSDQLLPSCTLTHRDSGLLDESNAEAISEAMQPFPPGPSTL